MYGTKHVPATEKNIQGCWTKDFYKTDIFPDTKQMM